MVKKYINTAVILTLDLGTDLSLLIEVTVKRVAICEVSEEGLSEIVLMGIALARGVNWQMFEMCAFCVFLCTGLHYLCLLSVSFSWA